MKTITVRYFAMFREHAGIEEETVSLDAATAADVPPAPNGIELPAGYKDWAVIGVSHRTDNNTLRVILGNDAAIAAAAAGC